MTDTDARLPPHSAMTPVLLRLQSGALLSPGLVSRIAAFGSRVETAAARTHLQEENGPARRPRYLLHGWACRFRHLPDGRRQIFDLILPGEGVGLCLRPHPLILTGVAALTSVRLVEVASLLEPETLREFPDLQPALQAQADMAEQRLLDQIVRLGRMTALERLAQTFVDLHARLHTVGLVEKDRFEFPLTQEVLADVAGLSVVHVNRTLQELRRLELVDIRRGHVRIVDGKGLRDVAQLEPDQPRLRSA